MDTTKKIAVMLGVCFMTSLSVAGATFHPGDKGHQITEIQQALTAHGYDTDADGDPITAALDTDVTNGTLTLNADYTIKTLVIGDENFTETVHIGSKVLDKEFAEQFIGKKVPLKEGDADTITNATVSSLAVIEAINLAAAQLMK